MLSHKYRFHGHRSLGFVFRNGQTVRGRYVIMRIHRHPKRVHDRVAVVVSKKTAKKAAVRNRIRRRIFEVARTSWPDIDQPYDIVFIVKSPELAILPGEEVRREITSLLKRGHLLHAEK